MVFWIIIALIIFSFSMFSAWWLIPQVLRISFEKNLFDNPNERKVHTEKIPRLGGVIFVPIIIFSLLLVLSISAYLGFLDERPWFFTGHVLQFSFAACALIVISLTGIIDDLVDMPPLSKLFGQFVSASLIFLGGFNISNLSGLFGIGQLSFLESFLISVVIIIGFINAMNLIDGINGLASGLSCLSLFVYCIEMYLIEEYIYILVALSIMGVLISFFYYNVFGKAEQKQKIFMGDTGSMTLGLLLSILAMIAYNSLPNLEIVSVESRMVIAFAPLFLIAFDLLHVFVYRILHKRSPFSADREHIHHKILDMGFNQSKTLVLILCSSLLIITANIFLANSVDALGLLIANILCWFGFKYWLGQMGKKKTEKNK